MVSPFLDLLLLFMGCYEKIESLVVGHAYDFSAGVKWHPMRIGANDRIFTSIYRGSQFVGLNLLNLSRTQNAALEIIEIEITVLNESLHLRGIVVPPLGNERFDNSQAASRESITGTLFFHSFAS
jgi:hypothetical protein